jgi:hypothetical protein
MSLLGSDANIALWGARRPDQLAAVREADLGGDDGTLTAAVLCQGLAETERRLPLGNSVGFRGIGSAGVSPLLTIPAPGVSPSTMVGTPFPSPPTSAAKGFGLNVIVDIIVKAPTYPGVQALRT